MQVICSEIVWDTSDSESDNIPDLPKTVTLDVPELKENEDQESLMDELNEELSNKFGWLVSSFNFKIA